MKIPYGFRAAVIAVGSTAIACGLILIVAFAIRTVCAQNPMQLARSNSNSRVASGRKIFVQHCAECHGFDARGEEGPSLYDLRSGDRLRRQIILDGIKKEMPAYKNDLNDQDLGVLLAYLRTLHG